MSAGDGKVIETLKMIDDFHGGDTKEYAKSEDLHKQVLPREAMIGIHLDTIAAACHMANRAYCIALGDSSQPLWEDAPEWQKSSARNGVLAILKNPDLTPEQSHEGWLKQKQDEGWKYGPVKDTEKKEHPCFVPYGELPEEQRKKDHIFGANVRSMGKIFGLISTGEGLIK